jgi:hypothetical protein
MDERQPQNFSFLRFRDKLVQNKKNFAAFGALVGVTSLLLASTVFFMNGRTATLVQVIGLMALGYVHVAMMKGKLAVWEPVEKLLYSLLLAFVIILFLSSVYLFTPTFPLAVILAGSSAFLLAYVLGELWVSYKRISDSRVTPWFYSNSLTPNQATVFLNSIPIRVKIQIEERGRVEYVIAFRAPVKMKLGLIFYHVIKEQNESGKTPVELLDNNGRPFGWVFFVPSLAGWSKSLDPEATLIENQIGPNAVIIARRVPEKFLSEASGRQIQTV